MLHIYTGRNRLLAPALIEALRAPGPESHLIVVPKQLTLQTERLLLEALNLRGSFALQVLSAERLCARIFDAAGAPEGVRVDDRGRVMLVRAAVRDARDRLTIYRGAERRRGFPERCAAQLEHIRQAGLPPEALRACAVELSGSARMKLNDLSYILEAYQAGIEGRYQDGASEFMAAAARAGEAEFLRESDVWFFGFDMMPPALHGLIAAVAAACDGTHLLLPLDNDPNARDFDAFLPMQRAFERLCTAARRAGTRVERVFIEEAQDAAGTAASPAPGRPAGGQIVPASASGGPSALESAAPSPSGASNHDKAQPLDIRAILSGSARLTPEGVTVRIEPDAKMPGGVSNQPPRMAVAAPPRRDDLRILERELFAYPAQKAGHPARAIQLTLLRNPQEECMFAAALTRRLVMQRGWRWNDVLILCRDLDAYAAPLSSAFALYSVPVFLASSRPAARHATAECLLTALRALEKGFQQEDMFALIQTGLMPITADEGDRLMNYAIRYGLRGARFLRPLRRGTEAEIAEMEPVRARLAAPLIHLREALREAGTLQDQLAALFGFLSEIGAHAASLERMNRLAAANLREAAGEEGQVWNRILGAMDQMHALMGSAKLSLGELGETLSESLSASVIKALPQSGDAVFAQSTDAACTRTARAILILGASDRSVSGDDGLLTPSQKRALSEFARAYLGPDEADLSRLRRFYLKSALGMASDYVSVSCPLSGADGSAQRPGAMFNMIEALFPGTRTRGGLTGEAGVERMLRGAPRAALSFVARSLAGEGEGAPLPDSDKAALAGLAKIAADGESAGDSAVQMGLRQLRSALNRAESADRLAPETARALYGTLKRVSVTRLELFAGCPFSHFMRYGLRPDRVEPFALNARDEGTFFHSAVTEFLLRSHEDLNDLPTDVAAARMDGIADAMLDAMCDSGPLGDSAVALAERRRLKETARACAAALADHMRGSLFHTAALEQSFGREDGALALELPGGCVLEGRIDRVDEWRADGGYLRVIDYKRGGRALKLAEAYYGLRLQLPVYLAAAQRKWGGKSAGAYYFGLSDGILATQSADPNAVAAERRKGFRMDGLLPGDAEVLRAMSPNIAEVVKARVSASGELYKSVLTATQREYDGLTRCALRHAAELLSGIERGACEASPARLETSDPCRYCDSRLACGYDDRLDPGRARKFKPMTGQEALNRLAEEP